MDRFETRGLYIWTDSPDQHDFWKACGVNMLQFCDLGWHKNANTILQDYYINMARQIKKAKEDGFRTNVILFANIKQWEGPEELEPSGIGIKFYPRNEVDMQERLKWLANTVERLKDADGFTFFAGDPGGVPPELGKATYKDWLEMGKRVGDIVKKHAPNAYYNLNPWAVTMWHDPELPCQDVNWWIEETELTQKITTDEILLDNQYGIEIPCHTYYRAMALRLYDQAGIMPVTFPYKGDVEKLKSEGIPRVWAWPYFLLDEADDGDVGPDGAMREMTQSEVRYIYSFVNKAETLGVDGIIGNWSYLGHKAKAMNTYAFGRFTCDKNATPEQVIMEYAENIAEGKSADNLAEIFKFIENQSNWQKKLPAVYRLPNFETAIKNIDDAIKLLEDTTVFEKPKNFSIPESPAEYFQKLSDRLYWIKDHQ